MNSPNDAVKIQQIPLNKLKKSPDNVRKTLHTQAHIEALAANIAANDLIQNLVVKTELKDGKPTGFYLVTAGEGRRLAQLLRVKQGNLPVDALIWCVIDDAHDAQSVSLAENEIREDMHPADQFEAFKRLVDAGLSIADVAAQRAVPVDVVKARLKLANLAPEFIGQYRKGSITLDVLEALALTDDHAVQRRVWKNLPSFNRHASAIRRFITQKEIAISDPMARFVTVAEYQKAGGQLRHDWFADDGETDYVMDVDLLRKLAVQKLDQAAAELKATGCAWVEVTLKLDYDALAEYSRLNGVPFKVTAEHRKAAGAVVTINHDGELRIEAGLLKKEDAARFKRAAKSPGKGKEKGKEATARSVHSAALIRRLAAHRTMGLRIALSQQPNVALVALAHRLLLSHFARSSSHDSPMQISLKERDVYGFGEDVEKSPARTAIATLDKQLREKLPKKSQELLPWLLKQPQKKVMHLLAFCVAMSLDGIQDSEESNPVDVLARATKLDMHKWWKPTAETYFAAVPKARILEVVKEAVSPEVAATLQDLKKGVLAKEAEKRMNGSDWLPSLLRLQAH